MSEKNTVSSISYRDAGVDIEAGNELVRRIAPLAKATKRAGDMGGLGGFGGLFDLKACGYDDPVLVAATDGVGTKLKLAFETGLHGSVGIDLVAMCVNDLLVQGAEPLFFLDYFATGGLQLEQAEAVIAGIAKGCEESGCQLLGGETAEMPGMYAKGEYDLAGFAVGAVERNARLPKGDVQAGDVLLGVASSGVHSNGFSLLRKLAEAEGLSFNAPAPFDASQTFGQACLTPTKLYIQSLLDLAQSGAIKAMAHITGGGLLENIPRVLPNHIASEIKLDSWPLLPIFEWIWQTGRVQQPEMLKSFNCGIGMVVVVAAEQAQAVKAEIEAKGETVYEIGQLIARTNDAEQVQMMGAWAAQ